MPSNTKWSDYDIYDNTPKEVIVVHRDTLDNKLRDLELGVESKRGIWHSTELILVLLGILLTSNNFKDFLGISPGYWFAIFFIAFILALLRLVWDLIFKFGFQKYPSREMVLEDLMAKPKRLGNEDTISSTGVNESKFLIQEEGKPEVYEVQSGMKRHIPDPETLVKLGYEWDEIHKVSTKVASKYQTGDPLPSQK